MITSPGHVPPPPGMASKAPGMATVTLLVTAALRTLLAEMVLHGTQPTE
jgi:hypothetical protein